jgi:SNF2 family DNA or RNA helicase
LRVLIGTLGTIGTGLTLFDPAADETASAVAVVDLPYTWAAFEQGIARLYREGQRRKVQVTVPITRNGPALNTIDEQIWSLIAGKRDLAEVAIDGNYRGGAELHQVVRAMRRWLHNVHTVGMAVEGERDKVPALHDW